MSTALRLRILVFWYVRLCSGGFTNWKPFGKRPVGRPKNRWIDGILKDMEVFKVKNWKEMTRNRKE
jgi:hypothetical protein